MIAKVCNVLSAFMIILLLSLLVILIGPKVIGCDNLNVLTASMYPSIPVGSLVTVDKRATPEELEPGDIVVFTLAGAEGTYATHRLMEKHEDRQLLITKGDNNDVVDSPIPYGLYEGRVILSVPRLGDFAANFGSRKVIPYVMAFLIVFILLIFIPEIFKKEA